MILQETKQTYCILINKKIQLLHIVDYEEGLHVKLKRVKVICLLCLARLLLAQYYYSAESARKSLSTLHKAGGTELSEATPKQTETET